MRRNLRSDIRGGATIEYAIFLAIGALLLVLGVAIVGEHMRPQIVAWHDGQKIDDTVTGSIRNDGVVREYRVYKLPKGLKNPGETE